MLYSACGEAIETVMMKLYRLVLGQTVSSLNVESGGLGEEPPSFVRWKKDPCEREAVFVIRPIAYKEGAELFLSPLSRQSGDVDT